MGMTCVLLIIFFHLFLLSNVLSGTLIPLDGSSRVLKLPLHLSKLTINGY